MQRRPLPLIAIPTPPKPSSPPIRRVGIVSRDYRHTFPNGLRDFSYHIVEVLLALDSERCDVVVFSMFSMIPRSDFRITMILHRLINIRMVVLEEFFDARKRRSYRNVVHERRRQGWRETEIHQAFAKRAGKPKGLVAYYAKEVVKRERIFGDVCLLICGEINGVGFNRKKMMPVDDHGLRAAVPKTVRLILNPAHDRMIRYEMTAKRKFCSAGRWLVAVWNRGKGRRGKSRDGNNPAWAVFKDGVDRTSEVTRLKRFKTLEVGVLDLGEGKRLMIGF